MVCTMAMACWGGKTKTPRVRKPKFLPHSHVNLSKHLYPSEPGLPVLSNEEAKASFLFNSYLLTNRYVPGISTSFEGYLTSKVHVSSNHFMCLGSYVSNSVRNLVCNKNENIAIVFPFFPLANYKYSYNTDIMN